MDKSIKHIALGKFTLEDFWLAPSGIGPLASEWADKPHRLLYDLIAEVAKLKKNLPIE